MHRIHLEPSYVTHRARKTAEWNTERSPTTDFGPFSANATGIELQAKKEEIGKQIHVDTLIRKTQASQQQQ